MCKFFGYSALVVVPDPQIVKMPPQMTFEQGAAFPVVYVSAYGMAEGVRVRARRPAYAFCKGTGMHPDTRALTDGRMGAVGSCLAAPGAGFQHA